MNFAGRLFLAAVLLMAAAPAGAHSRHASSAARSKAATGRCHDGTLTYSRTHRGACSHHGGVDEWFDETNIWKDVVPITPHS